MRLRNSMRTATLSAVSFLAVTGFAAAQDATIEAGRLLFLETAGDVGCASCHRDDASGDVGPNIQGVDAGFIRDAVHGGVEDMAFLELTDTEIEQVAAFLATLK